MLFVNNTGDTGVVLFAALSKLSGLSGDAAAFLHVVVDAVCGRVGFDLAAHGDATTTEIVCAAYKRFIGLAVGLDLTSEQVSLLLLSPLPHSLSLHRDAPSSSCAACASSHRGRKAFVRQTCHPPKKVV
jgi:hypothetical protein